jgi:autotransporter-associated beta strand protein
MISRSVQVQDHGGHRRVGLLTSTAFSGAFAALIAAFPQSALAACLGENTANVLCDAANPATGGLLDSTFSGDTVVSIGAGSQITGTAVAPDGANYGAMVTTAGLPGSLTFTNNDTVSGIPGGVYLAANGSVSYLSNAPTGDVTIFGGGGDGTGVINFVNRAAAGNIFAYYGGSSPATGNAVSISSSGAVGSIFAFTEVPVTSGIRIETLAGSTATSIGAQADGTGNIVLTGSGSVTARGMKAIITNADSAGAISIDFNGSVIAASNGITGQTAGSGNVAITGTGDVTAGAIGVNGDSGSGDVLVARDGVITGTTYGILTGTSGSSSATVNVTRNVTATAAGSIGVGVNAADFGHNTVTVSSGTVSGDAAGIVIWSYASENNVTIGAGATVQATSASGVGLQLDGIRTTVFNAGTISGAGAAINFISNYNTLTLAPTSAITGKVNAGGTDTLQLGGTGAGTFDVALVGADRQYAGFGVFNKVDASVWTLTGTPGQTIGWSVNGGTLRQGSAGSFGANAAFTIGAAGSLDLNGFTTAMASLSGAGSILLGAGTLTAGSDNTSTTFSGAISGSGGFTKAGTRRTDLTGISSYTGATVIDGGTLSVNGDITSSSGVTVNAGATLGGNGFVGNTTINGGTLAPGNSIGLLTVVGNLVLTSASSYMVEVSPTSADRVNVTGTATLGGATVNASFAAGSYVNKQYTIINAAGGVSGTFGSLVNTNLPISFSSNLSYDANNAYLNLALGFAALTVNQQNVGHALTNYFNRTGGIPLMFGGLTGSALTQASGETGTGSQQVTFDAMNLFMGLLTDPFTATRSVDAPNAMGYAEEGALGYVATCKPNDAFAMLTKAPLRAFEARWNVWGAGYGGSQTTNGNATLGSNTATSSIGGFAVGADYWTAPNTVAGFALAGGGTTFSVAGGGSGHSDLFQAGAFVRQSEGTAYVTAALAYGWQDISTERAVTIAGIGRLRAEYNANSYSARIEGGNRYVVPYAGGVGITPYVAAQVTALDLPSYGESANGGVGIFGLNYAAKTVTATRSELGLRADKSFAVSDAILTLRGRTAWAHDYNTDRSITATFQALPGPTFVVNGAAAAHDAALATASAEIKFASGISLAATFEGEFSDVTTSYAGKGVARSAW